MSDKAYHKAYREAHKEKRKAYDKALYEANKEEKKASFRAYYKAHKEKAKAYNEANKEKIKTRHRAYRETHKEDIKVSEKAYKQIHKEKSKASRKAYDKAHPERNRAQASRRRAIKAGNISLPIRPDILAFLIEVWDNKCAYCRQPSDRWNVDHFMPLKLKGHNAEYNLVLACPDCNFSKQAKHPFLFIKERRICFTFKPYMKFIV